MKSDFKEKAIAFRKTGLSYREIMEKIPVAKSTLSSWLHSVGLAKYQKQRLTEKKLASARHGGEAKRQIRIIKTKMIMDLAKAEIKDLTDREFWLAGIMLYWAEGSKEKLYRTGSRVQLTNMDPHMIRFFLRWLKDVCKIEKENVNFEIYIHKTHRHRVGEIIKFWSENVEIPADFFSRIYFKRADRKTNRKNVGNAYHGVLSVRVKSSTDLNRKIAGWTQGVVESIR